MKVIDTIKNFIANLDERSFYKYLIGIIAIIFLLAAIILYFYYSDIAYWKKQISNINFDRDEIQKIIQRDELVQRQREEVNTMLSEMPDFKIDQYFTDLINKLGLEKNRVIKPSISYADRGDPDYREVILNAKFDMMNMKQLTELLDAIEQNKRIYTKELEITKSKKVPNTIEVNLTVATLQRKPEITEIPE